MNATVNDASRADSPGVRIPPPAVYALAYGAGALLQWGFPLPFAPRPYAIGFGAVALALGVALALASILTMLRGKGTLNTQAASKGLVTSGVYRLSRNPMYVSNIMMYLGFAALFSVTWALALLPLPILYTHFAVILREERFLARNFGEPYSAYAARVRRWL